MGINYNKQIMIKCLFKHGYETYDGVKYDKDEHGKYFLYKLSK